MPPRHAAWARHNSRQRAAPEQLHAARALQAAQARPHLAQSCRARCTAPCAGPRSSAQRAGYPQLFGGCAPRCRGCPATPALQRRAALPPPATALRVPPWRLSRCCRRSVPRCRCRARGPPRELRSTTAADRWQRIRCCRAGRACRERGGGQPRRAFAARGGKQAGAGRARKPAAAHAPCSGAKPAGQRQAVRAPPHLHPAGMADAAPVLPAAARCFMI